MELIVALKGLLVFGNYIKNSMRIFTFILIYILFSCSNDANPKAPINYRSKDIDEFIVVFSQMCLTKSIGIEKVAELMAEDNSTSSELTLGVKNYRKISELADSISIQIRDDSLAWQNKICKDCS